MDNNNSNSGTITIKKDALWKYSTFILIAVLIVGGFFAFRGDSSGTGTATGNAIAPTQPSAPTAQVKATADDDPVLGDKNAPVEIIEFSDYQCPFCRKFWTETLPSIKSQYIDTGKVKFVYRDFPLDSIHPSATPAAIAAECVRDAAGGSDEIYFEYHDKIFSEQNILDGGDAITGPVRGTAQFSNNDLKKWAQDLGYDIADCLDSQKFLNEVQKDLSDATNSGGRGTPYFVINGIPVSGAQPFANFQQIIEAEL